LNFPPIESRNQRRSEACLNAEPLEKSELLGKQPLRSGVQIPQRLGFGSVELAVRRRSDGRLLRKSFWELDGLYRNSGLAELRIIKRRKSGKPDLRCQARQ
jgi:hypothetical protein